MRSASPRFARALLRAAGWLLGVGILVFLLFRLGSLWSEHRVEFAAADVGLLAAALAVTAFTVLAAGVIWVQTLRWLDVDAGWAWIALYLRAQLGKYLPGGVWQYVGRVALARLRGAPLRIVTLSLAIEFAAGAIVAAVVGLGGLYVWPGVVFAVLVAAGAFLLRRDTRALRRLASLLSRFVLRARLGTSDELSRVVGVGFRVALAFVPLWILHGLSLWLLAHALRDVPVADMAYYVGAFGISWLVGLAAVFAPGGIGVREAVLTAFLTPRLGSADAILVAVASRMAFVTVDLVGGVASFLPPLARRLQAAPDERSSSP